jgi:signal transduction histidine kinase
MKYFLIVIVLIAGTAPVMAGLPMEAGGLYSRIHAPSLTQHFVRMRVGLRNESRGIAAMYSAFLAAYKKQCFGFREKSSKEYTCFTQAALAFNVDAVNFAGIEISAADLSFSVLQPWYQSFPVISLFIMLVAGLVYLLINTSSAKLKKDNQRLEEVIAHRTAEIKQQKEEIEQQKDQVERSYQHVKTLSQIGQSITSSLDLESIMDILYYSIRPLMDFTYLGVGVYNDKTQRIDFWHNYEDGEVLSPFSYMLHTDTVIETWSFNHHKEVHINDIEEEYVYYLPSLEGYSASEEGFYRSVLCVPLQIKEKTLGVIILKSLWKNAYQPYHMDILRTLGAYTAVALDNSYAYLRLNEINEELSATLENLKQTQMQLVQSEKMASLGQLTAGVAHEINNPINFVSAGIDSLAANYDDLSILLEKYTALNPAQDNTSLLEEVERLKKDLELDYLLEEFPQLLNSIKSGASRTTEIVKSLRNFTRLDEESLKLADIHEGLDSTLVILKSQLGEQGVMVVKSYAELPPIQCYPGQLNQVFMNIMSNAIQAIEGEGKLYLHSRLEEGMVLISIRDTGKGMPEEIRQRIFEPFFTTKEVGEGTGLGLSISYGIIEKHKGKIEVWSKEGEGTEFRIHLPINLN